MDAGKLLIHGVEDAEAGRAVKTDVDVEVAFFAQPHGAVNRLNFFLVDGEEIGSGPEAIIHRQTDPVEVPIANPAKIVFGEHPIVAIWKAFHPIGIGGEVLEKIEAVPSRVAGRDW